MNLLQNQPTNIETPLPTTPGQNITSTTPSPTDQINMGSLPPTNEPTKEPTSFPTHVPTDYPTENQTIHPTQIPASNPTNIPTINPTNIHKYTNQGPFNQSDN